MGCLMMSKEVRRRVSAGEFLKLFCRGVGHPEGDVASGAVDFRLEIDQGGLHSFAVIHVTSVWW